MYKKLADIWHLNIKITTLNSSTWMIAFTRERCKITVNIIKIHHFYSCYSISPLDPVISETIRSILIRSLGVSCINFNPIYPFKMNAGKDFSERSLRGKEFLKKYFCFVFSM